MIGIDGSGKIFLWNSSAVKMFGYSAEEAVNSDLHALMIPERFRATAKQGFEKFARTGTGPVVNNVVEIEGLRKNGSEFPVELSISKLKQGDEWWAIGFIRDITKRRQAEAKIKNLSRTLKATSECNKALIRAKDESGLLADICRIVVETGEYRLAWVGEAVEENGERLVKPLAFNCGAKTECDYLAGLKITWSDDEFGRGPTGTAIRTGEPAVMRSIKHDPLYAPWRDRSLQYGFRSSISLPLVVSGKIFGALNIYSGREDAFDREELKLLEEMASDLAFGLTTLRTLKEKKRHGRLIELLLDSTSEGVYGVDPNGHCTFVNASCLAMLGYKDESQFLGKNMHELTRHTRPDGSMYTMHECPICKALSEGKGVHLDDEFFQRSDGSSFPVSYRAVPIFSKDKLTGAVVTFLDITEHLRVREALERSGKQLKSALDGAITAVSRMVEARDPYTSGHEARVALLACNIACEMGLDENIVEGIRMGATIHDIGKIHLPAEILSKPTTLAPVEFDLIKAHPQTGHDILADISFPWPVADIAWQHHEKLDGSGYPQGLKNGEIRLEARIVAVADVVEAMASHRPYRPALGIDKALEEIKAHRGDWYDPEAVDACIKLFTEKGFSLDTPT
jgi:PAS domain S-box-containing protein/putative nucleotidyltransferase with HDIG domain